MTRDGSAEDPDISKFSLQKGLNLIGAHKKRLSLSPKLAD